MSTTTTNTNVEPSTAPLLEMLFNPWSYFPGLIGGDLVGLGQVGSGRFLAAFGRTWTGGTPSQTDPPLFNNPTVAGPRVFDVDAFSRSVTEITPSLLMAPNASLRAAVMGKSGMHLIVSTNTGTHAQYVQHFASTSLRALNEAPLSPSLRAGGEVHVVEWDRGAAHDQGGFFAVGADSDNHLYVSKVTARLNAEVGYDPSGRSYLSDKGWTSTPNEQTPLCRVGGYPVTSAVPIGLVRRRQWWYALVPKQFGGSWGWELLRSPSFLAPFKHIQDVPGTSAGPSPARFFPGIVLETDTTRPPGLTWCSSPQTTDSFVPRLEQLQV